MFGPLSYNLYSNDLSYLVCDLSDIYNYADDNTICVHGNKIVLLDFFLQANPEKKITICFSKAKLEDSIVVDNGRLMPQASVKLLGIHIDHPLTFNEHISTTCKMARRQLNALGRLSNILNEREKYVLFECFIMYVTF